MICLDPSHRHVNKIQDKDESFYASMLIGFVEYLNRTRITFSDTKLNVLSYTFKTNFK